MEDTLKSIQRKARRQSKNPKNLGYFQNFNCGNAEVNNTFFNAGTGPSCTGSMGEDLDIEEKEMAEKTKLQEADENVEIKLNSDELNNPDSFSLKDTVKNRLDRVKQEKEDAEKQAEVTAFEAKYGPVYDAFMDSYGKRENIETVLDTMEDLVPDSGKADTVAGEVVRAINRIGYRYLNDGDEFYYGEGLDTVAPSVAYLCHRFDITSDIEEIAECELEEDAYYSSMCDIFWKILKELADHREYFFTKNIEDSRNYDASAIKKLEPLVDQEYYISEEIRQYVEAGKINDNDIVGRVEDALYDLQRQVDSDMSVSIYGYNVQINNVPKSIVEEIDRIFDYDEFWENYYEDLIDDYGDLDEVEEEYDDDPDYDFEDEEEDMDESLEKKEDEEDLEECAYKSMYEGIDSDDPEVVVSEYSNLKSVYDFDDQKDDEDGYFDSDWELVRTKTICDADGFTTDYTLYQKDGKYVCIFGDRDLYNPDDTEADAEFESYREALEWFDNYNGFEDGDEDFNECIHSDVAMHYSNEGKNPYDDDYCEDDSLDEGVMKELAYDAESDEKYVEKLQRSIRGLEEELDFLTNQAPKEIRRGGAFDSQEEIEDAKKATQRELNMEKAKLAILTRGD